MQNSESKALIVHLVTALESGGAEKVLFDTVLGLRGEFIHKVVVLSKRGVYCKKLQDAGVSVERISFKVIISLLFDKKDGCLIHSYLYHSHIASVIFKILGFRVIWSIHSSIEKNASFIAKLSALISYFVPDYIVYVSKLTRVQHVKAGFSKKKNNVVYNGINIDYFIKNNCDLKIGKGGIKIAMIARYHPIKDYPRFVSIAASVLKLRKNCCFYLIGKGVDDNNHELKSLINNNNLMDNAKLLGEVENLSKILPCFDLIVSTSKSESFGLTILEAILSGVNVSTINLPIMDELLLEFSPNNGLVSNESIAEDWIGKAEIKPSDSILQFVKENYSLDSMIKSYKKIYEKNI
jgi:glycosyltransferase involved in cell wall biosynthesis